MLREQDVKPNTSAKTMKLTYLEDQNAGRAIAAAREVLPNTTRQPALLIVDIVEVSVSRKASIHVVGT
jgi:hypothetical protein